MKLSEVVCAKAVVKGSGFTTVQGLGFSMFSGFHFQDFRNWVPFWGL